MGTPSKKEHSGRPVHLMKAGIINIQILDQTLKALKRIKNRVTLEQALYLDHSTIGTVQALNKWSYIYNLSRTPVNCVPPSKVGFRSSEFLLFYIILKKTT